jgi:hypothetical protein
MKGEVKHFSDYHLLKASSPSIQYQVDPGQEATIYEGIEARIPQGWKRSFNQERMQRPGHSIEIPKKLAQIPQTLTWGCVITVTLENLFT